MNSDRQKRAEEYRIYMVGTAKEKADGPLDAATCSPSSFPAMPIDAALEFAESGKSTGGIITHEALKTLAAAIRGRRCEFCNEIPLTETERKFILENAATHAPGANEKHLK